MGFKNFLAKVAPNSVFSHTFFPPDATFSSERDIPNLSGKVIIVTGGSSGIGYETCKAVLIKDAKVYLAARSEAKAKTAIENLEKETGKRAIFLKLDLADLDSVRDAATEFLNKESKLDVLFNNGGVMTCPVESLTEQGYDQQFGTNTLGHFFFTELLLPSLAASHAATGIRARVINTSSSAHEYGPDVSGFVPASTKGGPERDALIKKWGSFKAPWNLYGQSKLGNIFVAKYLAREHSDILISCSLHPGGIRSELQRHSGSVAQKLAQWLLYSPAKGALTQLWAGLVAPAEVVNGKPWARIGNASKQSESLSTEKELIAFLREQVKGF